MKLQNLNKQFYTEVETSHILNISTHKLQKDRRLGVGLKFHTFGRAIRYSIDDINTFIAENHYKSTSEYKGGA